MLSVWEGNLGIEISLAWEIENWEWKWQGLRETRRQRETSSFVLLFLQVTAAPTFEWLVARNSNSNYKIGVG